MSGSAAGFLLAVALTAACTYLIYWRYARRLDAQRRRAIELSALHLATIEALALAIDAKDQTVPRHLRRVQLYAMGLGQALGMSAAESIARSWARSCRGSRGCSRVIAARTVTSLPPSSVISTR